MQSNLDTETVLAVRHELEAIIEANPDERGYDEVMKSAEAALSSLDDALRVYASEKEAGSEDDSESYYMHLEDASTYVKNLKTNEGQSLFPYHVARADELLTALTH